MSGPQFFSEEKEKYSLFLARQARGGSQFFFIIASCILILALLVYFEIIFLNPNDKAFLIVGGLVLMVTCFSLSIWFFDYRRRVALVLDAGYWMVGGAVISISRRSENGLVLHFELNMPSCAIRTGDRFILTPN